MEIKEQITSVNYTAMTSKINKYIVIHYVGAVSTAKNNADYFKSINRGASANYFVDDNEIYRVVKDSDRAWHCGDTLKSGKGGSFNGRCINSNSIGIEMCCYNNNGTLDISEKTIVNTIELTKELMLKYNIPVENVIRHYDVTNKICPAPFVENESRWLDFKNRLTENNTQQTIKQETKSANAGIVATIQDTLNSRYGLNIRADDKFGNETKKALVIALQTELNTQYQKGLKVDGIFGTNTYNACVSVKKGAKGNITWILQAILYCRGYEIAVDGDFGDNTEKAVKQYQKAKDLTVDGVAGKNTFKSLLN
jgi:N-acetylmuramoyl-L-alanine amidase